MTNQILTPIQVKQMQNLNCECKFVFEKIDFSTEIEQLKKEEIFTKIGDYLPQLTYKL